MIDRNHPAVKAANEAATHWLEASWDEAMQLPEDGTAYMLTAALSHLTADDLRNTPAGRKLMAEAWEEAIFGTKVWKYLTETPSNPYRDGDA